VGSFPIPEGLVLVVMALIFQKVAEKELLIESPGRADSDNSHSSAVPTSVLKIVSTTKAAGRGRGGDGCKGLPIRGALHFFGCKSLILKCRSHPDLFCVLSGLIQAGEAVPSAVLHVCMAHYALETF